MDPAAPSVTRRRAVRQALPATHAVMVVFAVLSAIGVISLFVFSDRTEDWFAWTVVEFAFACASLTWLEATALLAAATPWALPTAFWASLTTFCAFWTAT